MNRRSPGDASEVLVKLLKLGFAFGGLMSLALGIWMILSPLGWFEVFPGRLKDFGPFNAHFVKDLGGWWAAGGILLLFALSNPHRFGGVALVVTLVSLSSSAFIHVSEIMSGKVGAEHWIVDAPTVFLPLVVAFVLLWIWWAVQSESIRMPEGEDPDTEYYEDDYELEDGEADQPHEEERQPVLYTE